MCARARARVCVIHWHCSAQLSMFNMEKRYRNKIIIIIIIIKDLLRQSYQAKICLDSLMCCHRNRSCRSNSLSHPGSVCWHWCSQSLHWHCSTRCLVGQLLDKQFWSPWFDLTGKERFDSCTSRLLRCSSSWGRKKIQTMIIIIIAFKGAIRDFVQSPHCAANHLQHVRSSGPSANVCKSRATHWALISCNMSWYMSRGTKEQLCY